MAESKAVSLKRLQTYLNKFAERERLIDSNPAFNCSLFIVIPVFKEEHLILCLASLNNCQRPNTTVEVILVFNSSSEDEKAIKLNENAIAEVLKWKEMENPFFAIQLIEENQLDSKVAGVGLARKIGMDEAVRRALLIGRADATILCLDADCTVSPNYLREVEKYFNSTNSLQAATIHFEHPIMGEEFSEDNYEAITYYELHLRYFKWAMNYIGLPYDRYTVGSSMAINVLGYATEGGMNKRKAGEDFYFLQKYLIKEQLGEIKSATVFPSPRLSDRVPFGTGRAIEDHQENRKDLHYSYALESFFLLKGMIDQLKTNYPLCPEPAEELKLFLGDGIWESRWEEMLSHSKDWTSFYSRFLQWFTPFRLLKFLHFLRDNNFPDKLLEEQVNELLGLNFFNAKEQLEHLRKKDQGLILEGGSE